MTEDLAARLASALDTEVSNLTRLSAGANMHTYAFDALDSDGTRRELILRMEPPDLGGMANMPMEASCLRAAHSAGVPVPEIFAWSPEATAIGSPFLVLERISGETIPRRILRGSVDGLAGRCGELLALVHRISPDDIARLPDSDPVAQIWDQYEDCAQPRAVLDLAFRWLRTHPLPGDGRKVLVHGDFRNGNLIIGDDGIRAVLDWELAHRGDPMEDLGWLCVKAWRFGSARPVGGFGTYEELFGAYERISGQQVDPGAVRWWQIFGTLRWGVMCMAMARRQTDGAAHSVELAAIGRRVGEQEHDLLLLLREGGA